ncbi:MAG: hypothetical protein GX767_04305 [Firmicutes bacterium]|nr:hypothetical protein [Bacillota bacterium]
MHMQDFQALIKHPLLASTAKEDHFFQLEDGKLYHYIRPSASKEWDLSGQNYFQEVMDGFEVVLDKDNNFHLCGLTPEGSIVYYKPPDYNPIPFSLDRTKKINHFSMAFTKDNKIYLLCQAQSPGSKNWLFFCYGEQKKCQDIKVLDTSFINSDLKGFLGVDHNNSLFVFYNLYQGGNHLLVYRELAPNKGEWDSTTYLSRQGEETFCPTYAVDEKNFLHLSWLSLTPKGHYINYTRRNPYGKWENYFKAQIKRPAIFTVPIFVLNNKLIIPWVHGTMLYHLHSSDNGLSWQWGESKLLKQRPRLCRHRDGNFWNCGTNSWQGHYTLIHKTPPQKILQPSSLFEDNLAVGPYEQNINTLNLLSSYLVNRAASSMQTNYYLQQQLRQKEKEIKKIQSHFLSFRGELDNRLKSKEEELEQLEAYFKQLLKELQKGIKKEKEKSEHLSCIIKGLKQENQKLQAKIDLLKKEVEELETELSMLKKEKEEWEAKKINSVLKRFFHKH